MGQLTIGPQEFIVLCLELLPVLDLRDAKVMDGVDPRQERSRMDLVEIVFNLR